MSKILEEITYDENVKKFLSQKIILAHILVGSVEEFKGMNPKDVVKYIDEPVISTAKVDDNGNEIREFIQSGSKIKGLNVEDVSKDEGTIYYDIKFTVYDPVEPNRFIKLYIDLEAQNDYSPGYNLKNRGIYYCSRMISSQKETEFTNSEYDKIKKVYSIWICTHCPEEIENTIFEISLKQNNIVGNAPDLYDYDLMRLVFIGLSKDIVQESEEHKLHRLLETFFSPYYDKDEKAKIIKGEFEIDYTNEIEGSVELMCNCSKGVLDEGIEIGKQIGIEIGKQEGIQLLAKAISECTPDTTVEDLIANGYAEDVAKMAIDCKK